MCLRASTSLMTASLSLYALICFFWSWVAMFSKTLFPLMSVSTKTQHEEKQVLCASCTNTPDWQEVGVRSSQANFSHLPQTLKSPSRSGVAARTHRLSSSWPQQSAWEGKTRPGPSLSVWVEAPQSCWSIWNRRRQQGQTHSYQRARTTPQTQFGSSRNTSVDLNITVT